MLPPDNSYFDSDSLAKQNTNPAPAEKKSALVPILLGVCLVLLMACFASFWLWRSTVKELNATIKESERARQEYSTQLSSAGVGGGSHSCPPVNCPSSSGNERFRNKDLGLVALLYNNLGEEIPIKLAKPGSNGGPMKYTSIIMSPDSDYQLDHLERLSFVNKGRKSSISTLCLEIPITALPPVECKRKENIIKEDSCN